MKERQHCVSQQCLLFPYVTSTAQGYLVFTAETIDRDI